jgi:hypothetical protein
MTNLTLVILAAGQGRRYGGLKPLAAVGPAGATLMDYAVHDAMRAGFGEVVFVVSPETEELFRDSIGRRLVGRLPVVYVHQRLDDLPADIPLPANRVKPWGTGQAVLAAAEVVTNPFAVVNADNYYDAASYRIVSEFLSRSTSHQKTTFAMVGYRLGDTLGEAGPVTRGVCRVSSEGQLLEIAERFGLVASGPGAVYRGEDGQDYHLPGDTWVSRNFWAFTPEVFPLLQRGFREFLEGTGALPEAEFLLPDLMGNLVRRAHVRMALLCGSGVTFGLTYREDLVSVRAKIADLVTRGEYPPELWQ